MSVLKKIYWKNLPPEDTQLLRPSIHDSAQMQTSLGPIIESTLANGEFVTMEIPKPAGNEPELEPASNYVFLHPASENWLSAQSCLKADQLKIQEIQPKPQIQQLEIINKSIDSIFFPAGLAFAGGAQNRVLLEPKVIRKGKTTIPVYCIEAGRWDKTTTFNKIRRLPDLLLNKFTQTKGDYFNRQIKYWELILESLSLTSSENQSMNAIDMYEEQPIEQDTPHVPKFARGGFFPDAVSGITIFRLLPGQDHFQESLNQWGYEQKWRRKLCCHAPGARLYFRIFDETKALAVKCHPDGKPFKNLRGKFDLFYYKDNELQNSYTPPIQSPPLQNALNFNGVHHIFSPLEFTNALQECKAIATKTGSNLVSLEFGHPKLPLRGNGLLHKGRLASLEAFYYESSIRE